MDFVNRPQPMFKSQPQSWFEQEKYTDTVFIPDYSINSRENTNTCIKVFSFMSPTQ